MAIMKKPVSRMPQAPIRPSAPVRPQAPAKPLAKAAPQAPIRPVASVLPSDRAAQAAMLNATETPKRGPGRPSRAELEARAAGEPYQRPAVSAPPPMPQRQGTQDNGDTAEMRRAIAQLTETVQQQNEIIAKLKAKPSNVRTMSEIVDGADNGLAADDWRVAGGYNGAEIHVHQFHAVKRDGKEIVVSDDDDRRLPIAQALLAIPRMSDPGGMGSSARAFGQLAVWAIAREDGTYEGPPAYVYQHELAEIWAD
jgi:hypothetical protein